jgi:hypothetical protein
VREEAGDAEEEADNEVGADRTMGAQADSAEEGGEAQRPQDEPHRAAEQPDQGTRGCGRESRTARTRRRPELEQEVEAVPREDGRDAREQHPRRQGLRKEPAQEGTADRGRRHPGDDPPVDPPGAHVLDRARERGGRAHGDVRPGGGGRAPRNEQDDWKPQASQHEADDRAEIAGDERAGEG